MPRPRIVRLGLLLLLSVPLAACANRETPAGRESVRQGIAGRVRFWEGDFMPGPERASRGTVIPVRREIRVHQAARQDSVVPAGSGGFFSRVLTPLAGVTASDDSGSFALELPPGRYSVFVVEDSLLYANLFDGQGYVFPVTVVADSVTRVQVDITSRATY
jgi:hypothetical protein